MEKNQLDSLEMKPKDEKALLKVGMDGGIQIVDPNGTSRIPFWLVEGADQGGFRAGSFLVGAKDLLPEDKLWRRDRPDMPALICLQEDNVCACPWGCIPKLVFRCVVIFQLLAKVEQIVVIFKREEKDLHRRQVTLEMAPDLSVEKIAQLNKPAPRIWGLVIPRDFGQRAQPYHLTRLNYDGLSLVMKKGKQKKLEVGMECWSRMG